MVDESDQLSKLEQRNVSVHSQLQHEGGRCSNTAARLHQLACDTCLLSVESFCEWGLQVHQCLTHLSQPDKQQAAVVSISEAARSIQLALCGDSAV